MPQKFTSTFSSSRRLICFFGLLLVLFIAIPDYIGDNAAARFNLTKAIVIEQRFAIDTFVHNTVDWSSFSHRYYSNKAPGVSFLLVPFYAAVYHLERATGIDPLKDFVDRLNLRVTDVFVTAVPSVVCCLLLFLWVKEKTTERKAYTVTYLYAAATIAFLYSSMLWGHQTAAAFLFASFYMMSRAKRDFLSGFLFGYAVLTEYSCALAILPFSFYLLSADRTDSLRRMARFLCGGIPALVLFCFYNQVCFGGPFSLPNQFQNPEITGGQSDKLFGVIQAPSIMALYWITFSGTQGLFIISPVLLLCAAGFIAWYKAASFRRELAVSLATVLLFILFNVSFDGWFGGWCVGPRYLVPMLPFLVLAFIYVRTSRIFYLLMLLSTINIIACASVDIQPKPQMNLLLDRIYPDLAAKTECLQTFALLSAGVVALWLLVTGSSAETKTAECCGQPE